MENIPAGYRSAIVSAVTVLLAFSLAFMRYWSFEADGDWWWGAVIAEVILIFSIGIQIYCLSRALSLKDDTRDEYNKTLRTFIWSIILLIVALILCMIAYSGILKKI